MTTLGYNSNSSDSTIEEFPESVPPERLELYPKLDASFVRRTSPRRAPCPQERSVDVAASTEQAGNGRGAAALARANQLVAEIEEAAHDNNNDDEDDDSGTDPTDPKIGRRSQQQPKKGKGTNFQAKELNDLLQAIEARKPISNPEWEAVARDHAQRYPTKHRAANNLKLKFARLWQTKVPTGDPNIPVHIKEAKRIWQVIQARIPMSNMQRLQGIESGVASMNAPNPIRRTTSNLTEDNNEPEYDFLNVDDEELVMAEPAPNESNFVSSAAKIVNRRAPKTPKSSSSSVMLEFATMNNESEVRDREWKREHERERELREERDREWKREQERDRVVREERERERERERQEREQERERERERKREEWAEEQKREELRERERERKREERAEEQKREELERQQQRDEREQEKNREFVRSLATVMATAYAARPPAPNENQHSKEHDKV